MPQDDLTRVCKKCGVEKPVDAFKKVKDCKHGRSRLCKECHTKEVLAYQKVARTTPQFKAARRAWREKNKDKIKHQAKEANVMRKYGVDLGEYTRLLSLQDGKCGICGSIISGRNATLDHCHTTGRLRGFLCGKCNSGLGMFNDRCDLLIKAVTYLSVSGAGAPGTHCNEERQNEQE